ncbi:hypothetical protein CVT25_004337 [Psilocybe cyanescens]|uniref:Chromatin modification-related protein EAF6 n=1 Tax=Psilocybe cyanescens TaxID=93625 RepID=A0A409XPY4_PSICY|nr:hypothetical protein CVT25_004337 [Psilocybe cyanescens]
MADPAGVPTADDRSRYETLKKELMQALPKKRAIDKQLAQIEVQIYNLEATYLTETAAHSGGNIIQGFENYLKNQGSGRRRNEVHDHDRVFSNSSLTFQKSLELMGEGEESTPATDEFVKQPTPGVTTIAVPPATRNQELTVAQQKKIKDREYQRRKRASASHRSTGDSEEELVSAASASSRRPTKRARLADDD